LDTRNVRFACPAVLRLRDALCSAILDTAVLSLRYAPETLIQFAKAAGFHVTAVIRTASKVKQLGADDVVALQEEEARCPR
jgi:hypothetical protein